MTNLPFRLPDHDQPATARIEVFTPAGGELGSLDASAYVCAEHVEEVGLAIFRAGFTPQVFPLAPDVVRMCGASYVYPTGNLADPSHPVWCNREDCERRGEHRSRVSHVNTNRPEATVVDVALIQALHPAAEPMLSLTSIEGPAAEHIIMSIGQGRALTYVMRRLIDLTKGGRR